MPNFIDDITNELARSPSGGGAFSPYRAQGFNPDPGGVAAGRYLGGSVAAGGRADAYAGQQQDLINQLQAQANGQGPSLAMNQLQRATDRNMAQAAALQNSQRGVSPALAARSLQMQQAGMQQQMAGQSADLRLQEQLQARQQLAGALGQARGQDLGQQAMWENANLGMGGLQVQNANNTDATNAASNSAAKDRGINLVGGLMGAAGAVSALSDERQKTGIAPADDKVRSFLESLSAQSFQYKDPTLPGAQPGPQVGVMAQDVAKTPLGAQMVEEGPNGKQLNPSTGFGAVLAAQASLHARMKQLEQFMNGGPRREVPSNEGTGG